MKIFYIIFALISPYFLVKVYSCKPQDAEVQPSKLTIYFYQSSGDSNCRIIGRWKDGSRFPDRPAWDLHD